MDNALPTFAVQADNGQHRFACEAWIFTSLTYEPPGFETYDVIAGVIDWDANDPGGFSPYTVPIAVSDGISSIAEPYFFGPEVAVFGTGTTRCIWTNYDDQEPDYGVYGDTEEQYY